MDFQLTDSEEPHTDKIIESPTIFRVPIPRLHGGRCRREAQIFEQVGHWNQRVADRGRVKDLDRAVHRRWKAVIEKQKKSSKGGSI